MNTADSTMATGVSEDYLTIKHYDISKGRDLQYSDIAMRSNNEPLVKFLLKHV